MRRASLTIGSVPILLGPTWPYPNGNKADRYTIPVYKLRINGINDAGLNFYYEFPAFRFGVYCPDGKTVSVVGLSRQQTHVIKRWIPTYKVHSAVSTENGAWQVIGDFLIHDGPDNGSEVFATIGCVEVIGPQGFTRFNDALISLMAPPGANRDAQLTAIGSSGLLSITYEKAERPPLKKRP